MAFHVVEKHPNFPKHQWGIWYGRIGGTPRTCCVLAQIIYERQRKSGRPMRHAIRDFVASMKPGQTIPAPTVRGHISG